MSAGTWPSTLPQLPEFGVSEKSLPNTVECEVDSGPPRVRRRSTKRRILQSATIMLTGTQYATLKTFYEDTLLDGSLTFDWTDAITDAAAELRFVTPPTVSQWTPAPAVADRRYTMTLDLEIM